MIIVKLRGGLGNQMFQYAYGKALSVQKNTPLFLDLTWYRKSDRVFLLDSMNVSYKSSSRNRLVTKLVHLLNRSDTYEGYWESPVHFDKIINLLKDEFTLKNPSPALRDLSRNIPVESIAVHVRRGDYLIPHGKYLNGTEYYSKAVDHIIKTKRIAEVSITIFSDDPEWCRKELSTLAGHSTEIFSGKLESDAEEMALMSMYGNNVISNSTFSWWAALLNKNEDKIVVMPENWFTDKDKNSKYVSEIKVPGWKII